MEVINFYKDPSAWKRDELFSPLRRFFGPYDNNPYDNRPHAEIKTDFLKAIHADPNPSFDKDLIEKLEVNLKIEGSRFREDFEDLLPEGFKVLLFPLSSSWEYVMTHLSGTWGVTFQVVSCLQHTRRDNLIALGELFITKQIIR